MPGSSLRLRSKKALADQQLRSNLDHTLSKTLSSRARAVAEVDNWEELRTFAHRVKMHTLARLGSYLEQFEAAVQDQGGQVFWAETAEDATRFILELAHKRGVAKVVKSKSMATEEIHLNPALERARITPVETDLGEYIVQLAGQTPSHILAPALHFSRAEVAQLFVDKVGMEPTEDIHQITATARNLLRKHFLSAPMGITGVNFGVAQTGTLVIIENEGNIRLCVSAPRIHVAVMGIEKILPSLGDLGIFLKLLTRSATGQAISSYVNLVNGVRREGELDGPSELVVVLVDNGRSRSLADPLLRQSLACIRCGACLNVCPVFQNIGGHAYGSTYAGPIGAVLTPQLTNSQPVPEHPFASSLCGACYQICPVKIEIPKLLLELRARVQEQRNSSSFRLPLERFAVRLWAWAASNERRFAQLGKLLSWMARCALKEGEPRLQLPLLSRWTDKRRLPMPARVSFREHFRVLREGR